MAQSLVFDMDGTLFQTDKILEISLEDAFNRLRSLNKWNQATPIDEYRDIMGVPLPKVWETLLPQHADLDDWIMETFSIQQIKSLN